MNRKEAVFYSGTTLIILLLGGVIAYGASVVGQHGPDGDTTQWLNFTNALYQGTVIRITQAGGGNFTTIDTGQGANELYDMDQNVLTTSDVNFTTIEADELYILSKNVTQAVYDNLGYTVYIGTDINREYQENYFYCDGVADYVEIQDAFDYVDSVSGGSLFFYKYL